MRQIPKPEQHEYPPYASVYLDRVANDGNLLLHLLANAVATSELIASLPESQLMHRYAKGKWTAKEVLRHAALLRSGIGDGKRVSVRALGYHIAGHELHHVAILKKRYLLK